VQLEYTLTSDGSVVDSTEGRGPFRYVHGQGQIIPGLERQLVGLHVGDSKEITVASEEAYGPLDPSAFVEVPKEQLPPNISPEVGVVLRGVDPDGRTAQPRGDARGVAAQPHRPSAVRQPLAPDRPRKEEQEPEHDQRLVEQPHHG